MEVAVLARRQHVELLAPVGTVAMADQPQVFEHVQRPIDRRWDCRRVERPAPLDELAAGDVAVRPGQHLDQRPALGRPAQPAGAQAFAYVAPLALAHRRAAA